MNQVAKKKHNRKERRDNDLRGACDRGRKRRRSHTPISKQRSSSVDIAAFNNDTDDDHDNTNATTSGTDGMCKSFISYHCHYHVIEV